MYHRDMLKSRPRAFLTARYQEERLAELPPLDVLPTDHRRVTLTAYPEHPFQTILGFGGSFTEAAAVTWARLDSDAQHALLTDYFDPKAGHGYSLGRVHMGSCDFALGNYSHVADAGDVGLRSFSIERDRGSLIPFLRAAAAVRGEPLRLLASPWSPPAWMKTTGTMNRGGKLVANYRAAWARCYVRFIQEYAAEGIPIWAVSVQNEPEATQTWDSCLYTGEEERDFVRDHLGPALHDAGLGGVEIIIWDHNRDRMVERAAQVYSDPAAARYVWGTGFHWYGTDHFDHVRLVHDAWPDKHLLFTEGCQEGGPHHGSWDLGERYARSMINDLNRWTEGWIDWNLTLDERGGPNHVGNYCSAPVLVDTASGTLLRQSSYYYIGHVARFVRPGARRILCATADPDVEAAAFSNTDSSLAIVVLNRTEVPKSLALQLHGRDYAVDLPPRSIATYAL